MRPQGQKIMMYIGIFLGTIGFIVGAGVAIIAAPIPGTIMTLFFIVVFGLTFGRMFLRGRTRARLLQTGRKASGKIAELWDTGVTVNQQPQIGMVIEVYPESEPPFKSEVKMVISRLETAYYQVGQKCVVRYDPNNKKTVALETIGSDLNASTSYNQNSYSGNSYFPGQNQQQIENELLGLEMEEKRILSTGKESRAIVKRMENTNVIVNGENPLYAFTLEVIPDDAPAYEAKVKGLIMPASVAKYQPGCQIYIKYDSADRTKITLFHS